jgi:hypothetical protein
MVMPVIPSNRLGVFGIRDPLLGTPVVGNQPTVVALIGQTLGAVTNIVDEAITRNALQIYDELANTVVNFVSKVSDVQNGIANYVNNVDYSLDNGNHIHWLGTFVQPPTSVVGAALITAGDTLAAGTYEYKITAIRQIATSPVTQGETTPSLEVSVVVSGGANSVQLSWTPSVNAQGYNVYRTAVNGATGTETLLTTVLGGSSNGFLDTGALTPGVQTPPVTNTANNRPADGANYYVSYNCTITSYYEADLFTSVNDLINAHSLTSDLCIAGTLIIGNQSGIAVGQGASQVMCVAVPPSPTLANYQQALQVLENQNVDIIVILNGTPANQLAVAQHVVAMSDPSIGKSRMAIFGSPKNTPIGDSTTPETSIYNARALNIDDAYGNPMGYRMVYVANSSFFYNVQFPDGSPIQTQLDGWFLAAAVAGRIAALSDVATPLTNKDIQGIISLGDVFTVNQRDLLNQNGLLVVQGNASNSQFLVYHGCTLDIQILENGEISIVRADDGLDEAIRTQLSPYIGSKITDAFLATVATQIDQVLGNFYNQKLIRSYEKNSISVEQDPTLKTRVNVTFLYSPIYPCNQILVQRGYDLGS